MLPLRRSAGNQVGHQGASLLADALKKNQTLEKLYLGSARECSSRDGVVARKAVVGGEVCQSSREMEVDLVRVCVEGGEEVEGWWSRAVAIRE